MGLQLDRLQSGNQYILTLLVCADDSIFCTPLGGKSPVAIEILTSASCWSHWIIWIEGELHLHIMT